MERHTIFLDWKNQYCENDYTTQSNPQTQYNPYQTTNGIFQVFILKKKAWLFMAYAFPSV